MPSDHSTLGRELDLFDTSALVGPGLPLWLPAGSVVRSELERFALELSLRSGCSRINTPILAKRELFERSGHWQKFAADMFTPIQLGGEEFVLRPANCPHHTQVYAARPHSYRDLPVRYAELGSMFRNEHSGVLVGLRRVRQINLDDAHSFCRPDQVIDEVRIALSAIREAYAVLGIAVHRLRLSVRGPGGSYLGDEHQWERAQDQLKEALKAEHLDFDLGAGEAAFYGPKIDVQVIDAAGREETLSTVQIDHVQPERFGLEYVGEDGQRHRPVMVHRGLLSSMERLVAILLDLDGGQLPTWLSPVQLSILPVSGDRHGTHAQAVADSMTGLRVECDSDGPLPRRIRDARQRRIPYIAVVGDAEMTSNSVTLSWPGTRGQSLPISQAHELLMSEVRQRRQERMNLS